MFLEVRERVLGPGLAGVREGAAHVLLPPVDDQILHEGRPHPPGELHELPHHPVLEPPGPPRGGPPPALPAPPHPPPPGADPKGSRRSRCSRSFDTMRANTRSWPSGSTLATSTT